VAGRSGQGGRTEASVASPGRRSSGGDTGRRLEPAAGRGIVCGGCVSGQGPGVGGEPLPVHQRSAECRTCRRWPTPTVRPGHTTRSRTEQPRGSALSRTSVIDPRSAHRSFHGADDFSHHGHGGVAVRVPRCTGRSSCSTRWACPPARRRRGHPRRVSEQAPNRRRWHTHSDIPHPCRGRSRPRCSAAGVPQPRRGDRRLHGGWDPNSVAVHGRRGRKGPAGGRGRTNPWGMDSRGESGVCSAGLEVELRVEQRRQVF
jgi:hypothetical protein